MSKSILRLLPYASKHSSRASSTFGTVRGTKDWNTKEKWKFNNIVDRAKNISRLYGFHEISTPIIESVDLFRRTLGETSDVVRKEMYTLEDLSKNILVLRPENTASVARAHIEEFSSSGKSPFKYFYVGPMYRYERPQKGRYREFHQFGVEMMGSSHPLSDVETIAVGYKILKDLEVTDSIQLNLNTLGDEISRQKFKIALEGYFNAHKHLLSADSVNRLNRGSVLRILDSKDNTDIALIKSPECPTIENFLTKESADRFADVKSGLESLGIPYIISPTLVRGLDYYCHTIFEFICTTPGVVGERQSTILAGGRYDGLIHQISNGSKDTPGVGWACGLERLLQVTPNSVFPIEPKPIALVVIPSADKQTNAKLYHGALQLSEQLRSKNIPVTISFDDLKRQMKKAGSEASAAIMFGESEMMENTFLIKNLTDGSHEKIGSFEQLVEKCKSLVHQSSSS